MLSEKQAAWLLDQFDIGASTAEKDPLLESAKIDTQEFYDLYHHDRIDIIRGIKGAGKTALYRVFYFLRDFMVEKKNLHCIFGVEATGDPVFRLYKDNFEKFNEIEFENFWGVYFVSLTYNLIFTSQSILNKLSSKDIEEIDRILNNMGLEIEKTSFKIRDIIGSILGEFKRFRGGIDVAVDMENPAVVTFKPTLKFIDKKLPDISKQPIYLAEYKEKIIKILKKNDIKIWLMLDRLDEVFPHRSSIELNGLKGLLKAAYNFTDPNLRIKIFLRDDILDYLTEGGFTALTHVVDRCSSTMMWSRDDIIYLVIKRICENKSFVYEYEIDKDLIDKDKKYREELFHKIFPPTIGKSRTIDWLYKNCSDSNGNVTPRDIIDFFKFAKAIQFNKFKLNPSELDYLLDEDTFKTGLEKLSEHKKVTFLFAEFPHFKSTLLRFEGKHLELTQELLQKMLGKDWIKKVDELSSIGFIGKIHKKGTFKIPEIWRKGFNMRRGKNP